MKLICTLRYEYSKLAGPDDHLGKGWFELPDAQTVDLVNKKKFRLLQKNDGPMPIIPDFEGVLEIRRGPLKERFIHPGTANYGI